MNVQIRAMKKEDVETCGRICYEAFKSIAERHNFPPDFPSPDEAAGLLSQLSSRDDIYSVVAEVDGRVTGSNFLWESAAIAGVGPITVDPDAQNGAIGRQLMDDVMRRAHDRHFAGIRLVQAAYHNRSLLSKLSLVPTRAPLFFKTRSDRDPGRNVAPASEADLEASNKLCFSTGHDEGRALSR